ncbi:minor capsid protein [Shewanella algae]|uniref:minor capsid protein n=1 Tax=Shewanella algae TaxID=38313 RepID=UPI0031F576D6
MATSGELRAAQNAIASAISQHASYQYRASSAIVNQVNSRIDELAIELAKELLHRLDGIGRAELESFLVGRYNTTRLKGIKEQIDNYGQGLSTALNSNWSNSAAALAGYEATYIYELFDRVFEDIKKPKIADNTVYKKAMDRPLSGSAPFGGRLVDTLLSEFSKPKQDAIYASIRAGVVAGNTNSEIVKAIRGTAKLNYQDGLIYQAKIDAERLIRTARNHISNQAYNQMYDEIGVDYVVFLATLDGRTSKICASLDGKSWLKSDPHPVPPLHPNCRSQLIPSLDGKVIGTRPFVRALKVRGRDGERSFRSIGNMTKKQREKAGLEIGQVDAKTNYSKWFANQDAEFKREWLGPTRYKLYTEGKYPLSKFADPLTGRQYSIDELRMRDAQTFRQIFGD